MPDLTRMPMLSDASASGSEPFYSLNSGHVQHFHLKTTGPLFAVFIQKSAATFRKKYMVEFTPLTLRARTAM